MKRLVYSGLWGRQGWVICIHCPLGFSLPLRWAVLVSTVSVPKRVWVQFLRLEFSEKEGFTDSWASEFGLETGVGFQPHICVCFEKVTEREKITQVFLFNCCFTWAGETSEASLRENWCAMTTDPDVEWGLRARGTHSSSESFYVFVSNSWNKNLGHLKKRYLPNLCKM